MKKKETPLVSISCITYNHSEFIKECLDGFLMQKTDFSYEILINDDASTDNTAEIIKEYQSKYPDLIFPIYQRENQYSIGHRRMNAKFNFPRAKGKYIALCEGDDFWTDPYKLQKQVDFLSKNSGYSICGTRVRNFSNGKIEVPNHNKIGDITLNDVLWRNPFSTCTVLFDKILYESSAFNNSNQFFTGDWPLWCGLLTKGKGFNMDEITAQYNIHPEGLVSGRNKIKALKNKLEDRMLLMDNFPEKKKLIKNYGYKIIFHFLWKSLLFNKVYFQALISNRYIVQSFLMK